MILLKIWCSKSRTDLHGGKNVANYCQYSVQYYQLVISNVLSDRLRFRKGNVMHKYKQCKLWEYYVVQIKAVSKA